MDIVGEPFHVGKFLVRLQHALRVAFSLPGIVDIDIHIARVLHPAGHHCVRDFLCSLSVDFFREFIPAIPAHGRCLGQRLGPQTEAKSKQRKDLKVIASMKPLFNPGLILGRYTKYVWELW